MLGQTGLDDRDEELADRLLAQIGLVRLGSERAVGHLSRVVASDPAMLNYEADFLPGVGAYPFLRADVTAESHLSVVPRPDSEAIDLVVTGPGGGYAHADALLSDDPRLGMPLWVLDPFAFFERSLGTGLRPIPDTTTHTGLRVFFATVASDGWLEQEPSRFFGQNVRIGGELLLDTLIAPYPDLPVTVSVLLGDLDVELAGPLAERGKTAAAGVLALSHVEAATSGHDMVRNWQRAMGESADTAAGASANGVTGGPANRLLAGLMPAKFGDRSVTGVRKYGGASFDPGSEIGGSLAGMKDLVPAGKPVGLFMWSRNSKPATEALDALAADGGKGFGGGWHAANPALPVLAGLAPFSARVGSHLQVYEALPDDTAFTGNWIGDLTGFHGLGRTLEWSETPRRLTPFHLSYSARSALHFATRSAVRRHLELARSGRFAPVTASDYVSTVEGFDSVTFAKLGETSWKVLDRGGLQTLRIPHAAGLSLDMAASPGTLGAVRAGDDLYVALDPGVPEPVVTLTEDEGPAGVRPPPGGLAVASSDLALTGLSQGECTTHLTASGRAPGHIVAVAAPGSRIAVSMGGAETVADAGADGLFRINVPQTGQVAITFQNDCGEG